MILIIGIVSLFTVLIACFAGHIVLLRAKYKEFYCPKYRNLFLAHAYELVKLKKPFSDTFLLWARESGWDTFVLFSSWRVHVHIIDTNKIKAAFSAHLLKPKESDFWKFHGTDLLGQKSLFTEPGSKIWEIKRKAFDPFFHTAGLQRGYNDILHVASELVSSIQCDDSTNITSLMQKHVSFVIAVFVMDLKSKEEFYSYSSKIASIFAGLAVKLRHKNTFWLPWTFRDLKKGTLKDLHDVREYFKKFILSQNFEELNLSSVVGSLIKVNMEGNNLMIDLLINELVMFFFAGIDTSMHTINFAFYEMLQNKPLLFKIEEEIKAVFRGREFIDYNELNKLEYLDKFIKEVLRYHPIVSAVTKVSGDEGFMLGDKFIPANTKVHINIECAQKSEKFWEKALEFSVDRWDKTPAPFSFIPFSGGTRSCIGKKLALLEIKVFISSVLRKYTIDFDKTDLAKIETKQVITNRLAKDLKIHFKPRV